MQEPAKKDWKAKREPQLLQLFLGRGYAQELGLQDKAAAGLEKIESVMPWERGDGAAPPLASRCEGAEQKHHPPKSPIDIRSGKVQNEQALRTIGHGICEINP